MEFTNSRVRAVPFMTRRPTFNEVKRVHGVLSSLEFYGKFNQEGLPWGRQPGAPKSPRKPQVINTSKKEEKGEIKSAKEKQTQEKFDSDSDRFKGEFHDQAENIKFPLLT
jgi:hypothetical protein